MRAAEELIEAVHRAEGEAELQQALASTRTVGATFFVQRGEALQPKGRTAAPLQRAARSLSRSAS